MAIAKKPNCNPSDSDKADRFITGHTVDVGEKAGKRVAVIVRFSPGLLAKVDAAARKLDLGRAAWLRLAATRAIESSE